MSNLYQYNGKKWIEIGKNGQDGKTPILGVDFIVPIPENGKDGSPDTPDEIATKLNTLEQKVEIKAIKGIEDIIRKLQMSIREAKRSGGKLGSGGMGNWVHQVFNTSSATTSVTVDNNIAAGGNAIIVRYQGQMLAHGQQYTVSGKTITFTFALEDDTFIDITYVRS